MPRVFVSYESVVCIIIGIRIKKKVTIILG